MVSVCTNMFVSVTKVVNLPGPLSPVFYFFMVLEMEPEAHRPRILRYIPKPHLL